ncbi:hypothetical protein [Paenibacillus lautus]|uniref:hypothetical protein n=1 Tax=Paenibacillus lautus TaxID=1401 RepID=UPI003D26B747
MNVEVYTLNAFAKGERDGNPAGVVLEDGLSLDAAEMQLIAKELRYSRGERDRNIQRCPAQLFVPTWPTIFAGSGACYVQARVFDGLSF